MSQNTQHTPGPWGFTLTGRIIKSDGDAPTKDIARVVEGEFNEYRANITLIAAAPDLVEALRAVMGELWSKRTGDVRKDFSLLNAHAAATKALLKAGVK